jgi:transposase-like protein
MTGNDGIAPDGTRILLCGLSYRQIVSVAGDGVGFMEAARKLGVEEAHFRKTMHRLGLSHWFKRSYARSKCLSADDIRKLAAEGYNRKDAAFIAGVNYSYFKRLVREYGLQDCFPSHGYASWISRRGYAK